MAQVPYRANLSSAIFPLSISEAGRTVIVPQADQNFDRRVDPQGEQKDAGIPQALYLENVIPTVSGYQSVGYKDAGDLPPRYTAGVGFPSISNYHTLKFGSSTASKILTVLFRTAPGSYQDVIASDFSGDPIVWTQGTGATLGNPLGAGTTPAGITVAKVQGINYVFDGIKLYTATNPSANVVHITDVSGSVVGIPLTSMTAICSAANYMIALSETGWVYWSSLTSPTDFTASLVTGAGNAFPNDLKGTPMFLSESENGFYIYTTAGVIHAAYTGNARYPWKFSGVDDAGGYTFHYQAITDRTKAVQYAIDNGRRVKAISPTQATLIAPEVSTFFERKTSVDTFSPTPTPSFSSVSYTPAKRIYYLLERYIATPAGEYIFFYDILLQRYGRLKVPIEFAETQYYLIQRYDSITSEILLMSSFDIMRISFDVSDTSYTHAGVFALGKVQYVRNRNLKVEEVEIEGEPTLSTSITTHILPSMDGRNFTVPRALVADLDSAGGLVSYHTHITAKNHTVLIQGRFSLSTIQLSYTLAGDR